MTCAKQRVIAKLITAGGEVFIGENLCKSPQEVCPRGSLPTGVGYELCKSVCNQGNHAEVNAILMAGTKANGSTIYLNGHSYACDSCKQFADAHGVKEIIIGDYIE